MQARAPEPQADTLLGDLRERADGGFDGWCWSPARPGERLVVELLVNDTVAVSMVAAIFRRDLLARGCGDGRHGFALRLPGHLAEPGGECLITARERRSGRVFGRLMRRAGAGVPAGGERVAQAAAAIDALWLEMDRMRALIPGAGPASAAGMDLRLRSALGGLAGALGARAARRGGLAALPGPLGKAAGGRRTEGEPPAPLVLPEPVKPTLTVMLRAGAASAALRHVAALAPALADAGAELLLADLGEDPTCLLLPARVRNLRYLHAPQARGAARALALAAGAARGRWLVLVDPASRGPSAAALLALGRALAEAGPGVLVAAPVAAAAAQLIAPTPARTLALPASLGLLIGAPTALWGELGPVAAELAEDIPACADLALRGRLLGHAWRVVYEPVPAAPPAEGSAASSATSRRAALRLVETWGGRAGA